MVRRLLPAVALGLALLAPGFVFPGTGEARAQGCLSAGDARAAVQSGEVVALSRVLGQIRSAVGGEILPPPQLCDVGGRLVYLVNVLTPGGKVTRLTVDARSGSIQGY